MNKILFITFIIIAPLICAAQQTIKRWALQGEALAQTTGAYAESMRIPGLKRQLNDGRGLQLNAEYVYAYQRNGQIFQHVGIMQYYHPQQEKGFSVAAQLGYRQKISIVFLEALIGAGFLRTTFYDKREFQNLNGDFYKSRFSIAGFTPSVAVGVGANVNKALSTYIRYYHLAQLQSSASVQGIRLHRNLAVGIGLKM
ncbi:MAG: hypothetical protein J0I84_16230 [Terrimonas sp.]|nr:hypothetical protein [Terrimonas sp.]OJY86266.1 MAG: hypothetical protein BGP13_05725 [Sphingobacteriales bacterium 40-81]